MSQMPLFDYAALDPQTGALARQRAQEIQALLRRSAADIIAIGCKLAEVKAQLAHGQFLDWLNAEFGWHRCTANRFMQVAEAFSSLEMSQIATFAPSALYLLASPSAPQAARAEALARAARGETITYSRARAIMVLHQDAPLDDDQPLLLGAIVGDTVWDGTPGASDEPGQPTTGEVPPDLALLRPAVTATPEELTAGIQAWLVGCAARAEDQAAILTEIAARSTTGLDHLNALLTSSTLPAPFRNRDVLAACKVLETTLEADAAPGAEWADGARELDCAGAVSESGTADIAETNHGTAAPGAAAFLVDWRLDEDRGVGPIRIIRGDARRLTTLVPPGSVHLIITSPPYNVGVGYQSHDDALADDEYIALLRDSFGECATVLVDGGRIAVVVPAGVGRNPWRPLASRVAALLAEAGLTLRGQIIWDKGACGNRTTWGSFRLPTDPSLRDTTETIVVAHKGSSHLAVPEGCLRRDASGPYSPFMPDADTFMALAQDHWAIAPESASAVGHPAPFPVALVERLIRFYAYPGAQVVDPFAGSGTTGLAALRLGCRATLVDIDPAYCELARRRCAREVADR
jgi:modification methylase